MTADYKENCSVRCMNSFVTSRFDIVTSRSIRRKLILCKNFDIIFIEIEGKIEKIRIIPPSKSKSKRSYFIMPYTTYANQKSIRIHKPAVTWDFLQIANSEWMTVNKQLGPYALQLYLYLAANADGFNLELSPQHAENDAGIRRTTFYEYMRKLEINGYLVWRHTNTYDFYTTARPADERSHPDKHQEGIDFEKNPPCESTVNCESAAQNENSPDETVNPSTVQDCSHRDIVIDNI